MMKRTDMMLNKIKEMKNTEASIYGQKESAIDLLEEKIFPVLQTYSNIHRGSGHNSVVTSGLYDRSRNTVLEYLGLDNKKYIVIFCTPRRAAILCKKLDPEKYRMVSDTETGLSLGVRAIAVKKKALPGLVPFMSGGGTARLVSPGWVIWAKAPERFEPGTPAIVNIIAFAEALKMIRQNGPHIFSSERGPGNFDGGILKDDEFGALSGRALLEKLRETLIGKEVIVNTKNGPRTFINLDNAASTRTFKAVWDTVRMTWRLSPGSHGEIAGEVRSVISETLGAPLTDYDVMFTSNTTESINLVAESLSNEAETGITVLNTILEHNSNDLPWRDGGKIALVRVMADPAGYINLDELENVLKSHNDGSRDEVARIRLVAVSGASNVLGTFNDLKKISRVAHKYGARLLVDGAQMVAHRRVDMQDWGVDYLAFSAHKVYAPFGTGVLVARKGLLKFDRNELAGINASGEENEGGIAALGKSLLLLRRIGFDLIREEESRLTGYALKSISGISGIMIHGISDPESPSFSSKGGVISFSLKNKMPWKIASVLAGNGIGVRYGCHCAHMLVKHFLNVPRFLAEFQGILLKVFPAMSLPGVVRISFGIENGKGDIDILVKELDRLTMSEKD